MEIGVDCTEISRFENMSQAFKQKIFTDKEIEYCENKAKPAQHYAAKFAGKEATVKALSSKGTKTPVEKIEVLNDKNGLPYLNLPNAKISLAHSNETAIAFVIIE